MKRKKCQPQNFNCGRSCISGTYMCHVEKLEGQSVSIANRLESLVNKTPDLQKAELDFSRNNRPLERILSNGESFAGSVMNLEEIDSTLEKLKGNKEALDKAKEEKYEKLDEISFKIADLDDELMILEDDIIAAKSQEEADKLQLELDKVYKQLSGLRAEYKKTEDKPLGISKEDMPEVLNSFSNLLNSLSSRNTESPEFEYDNNTISPERLSKLKDNFSEASNILGLSNKIKIEYIRERAYAKAGLTNKEILLSKFDSKYHSARKGRRAIESFYKEGGKGKIDVGAREDDVTEKTVNYHELAHHAEFANRDIAVANRQWIESRGTGKVKTINELNKTSVYKDSEVAFEGDFTDAYVARKYNDSIDDPDITTEVFAMGFQEFTTPESMLSLYNKDREHFMLTVGNILESQGE